MDGIINGGKNRTEWGSGVSDSTSEIGDLPAQILHRIPNLIRELSLVLEVHEPVPIEPLEEVTRKIVVEAHSCKAQ